MSVEDTVCRFSVTNRVLAVVDTQPTESSCAPIQSLTTPPVVRARESSLEPKSDEERISEVVSQITEPGTDSEGGVFLLSVSRSRASGPPR